MIIIIIITIIIYHILLSDINYLFLKENTKLITLSN